MNTHAFLQQPLTRILQAPSALLHAPPANQHALDLLFHLADPMDETIARLEVTRDASDMCAKVGVLAVCYGPVYEGEPVVELLGSVYWL